MNHVRTSPITSHGRRQVSNSEKNIKEATEETAKEMKLSAYISICLFLMLFIYNSFGDNSIPEWNVFYWVILSWYIAGLNIDLFRHSVVRKFRFIFALSAVYWGLFGISEFVTLFTGNYFHFIATVNLWLSRSMIIFVGLILFHFKFYHYGRQHS